MTRKDKLTLEEDSRVGVVGAGPAGSFFSFFLLDIAERVGLNLHVDLYEEKNFSIPGPQGCNKCAGVISESLVQLIASEGIDLPEEVVRTGIDSYVLHTDIGSVRIETPLKEARIATVYRGIGPKGNTSVAWNSFDKHLTTMATHKGANLINERVVDLSWQDHYPQIHTHNGLTKTYDLLVIASGVNAATSKLLSGLDIGYKLPKITQTSICEFHLGEESVEKYFGNTIHVFLLDIPKVDFAMFIPKVDFVTFCMLGVDLDNDTIQKTLRLPEITNCLPPGWQVPENYCHCRPNAAISDAVHPYTDRVITIGDCGVTRLYKDGIGAAYKAGKAAAVNAIFNGISGNAFREYYGITHKRISRDNLYGKIVFRVTRIIRRVRFIRHGVIKTLIKEQKHKGRSPYLSMVLWDTFTGSAPYKDVVFRSLHPMGFFRLLANVILSLVSFGK